MPLLSVTRRCNQCEDTRELIRELRQEVSDYRREVKESLLDYNSLYDKVRVNLAKLAKRSSDSEKPDNGETNDPIAQARLMLLQRKLGR